MRPFELLLVLSSFTLLLTVRCSGRLGQRMAWGAGLASAALVALQLALEGYRWPLIPVYMVTGSLIPILLFKVFRTRARFRLPRPVAFSGYAVAVMLLGVSVALLSFFPVFHFAKPNGAYEAGTMTFHFTDERREEMHTASAADHRELVVQIWYPAVPADRQETGHLFPESEDSFNRMMSSFAEKMHVPAFVLDYWKYIRTNSYVEADPRQDAAPYPVVILSHGMGTSRLLHTSQAEQLASHGYMVVAPDHTYNTMATAFPDGRVTGFEEPFSASGFFDTAPSTGAVWSQDVDFIIDQLELLHDGTISSPLQGTIDLNRIGMMGHSFGGATAFEAVYSNPRIKAGINMDGALYNPDNKGTLPKPFLFMEAEDFMARKRQIEQMNETITDEELKKMYLTREILHGLKTQYSLIDRVAQQGATLVYIEGAAHYNFTDFPLFSNLLRYTGMAGDLKGTRGADIINQYVLDFFNKHLKGTGGKLLQGPSAEYPEVKFPYLSERQKRPMGQ
ncbi:alpha/beta hydrolase family protein [Paenibacillus dendritiformis]|uniref:Platelet-activating factor acetylhydrolase plasma/intracellular isoform II n=1 Tax=Paenibacillus dendritiformis C454 TaxID=1131935 RepID=H3SKF4_9BACL|nr:dienelactone hydrolase family protein [Paenibacillus dendritiformis]EHQ60444.1 Platelet-activating factor acetylhydrolase plasma/intracellular isoform II [Paenibacillus dendritiformis C454]CAH8770595.1 dienelactone hydrolase family protein [Paenibacillus dendritiformis]